VGPDNGLLIPAAERFGGVAEAVEISDSPWRLEPVSATFHGRDLFAPVAAHLAAGEDLREAGEPLGVEELAVLELPRPRVEPGAAVGHALLVDGFGNVALNLAHEDMLEAGLTLGTAVAVRDRPATVVQTFADVAAGNLLVYEDAWGAVAVAINRGDAASELGIARDDEVRIARR
jgi:S-adenosylmethionine hydrolase